ncbi:MAG: putative integral outer membrane protein [Chitinophagaceae bacterium]|nr:putative integral outer membrane protein [Chitinophagaceae bacterium]
MSSYQSLPITLRLALNTFVFVVLGSSYVLAQSGGEVQSETVVIEKEKKLELPPANREFEKIPDPQPQVAPTNSKYQTQEIGIVLPQFDTKVKVPTTKTDEPVEIHNNYIKAGFGNYVTPYLEGFVHTGKQKNYSLGARFKHLSSANGPYKGVKNSVNEIDLQGKYWFDKQWVKASFGAGRERYTWYGVSNHDNISGSDWSNDSRKILFTKVNADVSTGSMGDGKLGYNAGVKFGYQSGNHNNKEANIDGSLNLSYQKEKDVVLGADLFVNSSNYSDSVSSLSRLMVGLTPKYTMTKDQLVATFGLNYTYSSDTLTGSKGSHLYPIVDLTYTIVPNKWVAEGGFKGGMEKNTWSSFTAQNPYLANRNNLANTNNKINLYARIKGNLGNNINIKVGGAYLLYRNLSYMTNSASDSSKFALLYSNDNTSVFNLNGEISYDAHPFRTGLKMDYYGYSTSNDTLIKKPWHRPSFVGTFFATYTIYKKIVLKTDIYYISGLTGYNLQTLKETKLNDIIDVNLKAEYRFSDEFSAFIEANNLLSQKYQRYMNYQSRGINLLFGVTYRF